MGGVSYYLLLHTLMRLFVVAIRWYTVSNPLTLPKESITVILHLSCIGNETNITDCIDSEPDFVTLCNNSQSAFIEVTCPGMTTLTFHVIAEWLVGHWAAQELLKYILQH